MANDMNVYFAVLITAVLSSLLVLAILLLNAVLGPKRLSQTKLQAFECGNPPADSPRKRFHVKYYVVAIAFVAFDLEAVFLFPWAVVYRELLKDPLFSSLAFVEALVFICILALGLWAIWKKGAFEWAYDKSERNADV